MAQASFHQNQRVFVKTVGTWAIIEKVVPHWVKGLDEPLRISYDLGLGRLFASEELAAETDGKKDISDAFGLMKEWRLVRGKNRWVDAQSGACHPRPGSHPVVVTDDKDWGGWKVPVAEYNRNPDHIEFQARLIAMAPQLLALAKNMSRMGSAEQTSTQYLQAAIDSANFILSRVYETNDPPPEKPKSGARSVESQDAQA